VASPDYIKRFGPPTSPSDLANHRCISYSPIRQPKQWSFTNKTGDTETVDVNANVLCNSAEMELALVIDGHGITRMPGFNIQQELEQRLLVSLFEDYVQLVLDVFLVYPSRKHQSPKVRAFIDFVIEHLDENALA